jgi:hypothetical protein
MKWNALAVTFLKLPLLAALFLLAACGPSNSAENTPTVPAPAQVTGPAATAYPGPDAEEEAAAYPGPEVAAEAAYPVEGLLSEPPDPERDLPEAQGEDSVIGGVLVRELTDQGFLPLTPRALLLAEVVLDDKGEPAFIRHSSDSPQAELLPTGVFVFSNVTPGTYGLVVDMGFAQLPVTDAEGEELTFTTEPGQALDLGQVFVQLPGD